MHTAFSFPVELYLRTIWDILLLRDYFSILLVSGFIFMFLAVGFLVFTQVDHSRWITKRSPPNDSIFYISFAVFFAISVACFVTAYFNIDPKGPDYRVIVLSCDPADMKTVKNVVRFLNKKQYRAESRPTPSNPNALANNSHSSIRFFNTMDQKEALKIVDLVQTELGILLRPLDFTTNASFADPDVQFRHQGYFEIWLGK